MSRAGGRARPYGAVALVAAAMLVGCGERSPTAVATGSVGVTGVITMKLPFHGPQGPGREPTYVSMDVAVRIAVTGDRGVTIHYVRTQLTEPVSGAVLVTETGSDRIASPFGSNYVPGGATITVDQHASALFDGGSSAAARRWEGHVTVEVSHEADGHRQVVEATFSG